MVETTGRIVGRDGDGEWEIRHAMQLGKSARC
jgi:hypothetical protein